ncbi:MACPF domain-containing protein [Caerostris extrusa]|uniref:MACPF domain-containing protein n=1 Tax=Caerostris extrusa TaxID=172846 RepID=A0AAV4QXW6_CAEEX|nr:MACPF domain-containing protein [Caerostris extrusa]
MFAVVEQYITDSKYRLVENSADVKDFLDVKGKLSLKIKSGMIDASGEGSYVKQTSSYENKIQIVFKVRFETKTMSIPSYVKPNQGWAQMNQEHIGTHYMRSITYGGVLIGCITIKTDNKGDMERIKGALNVGASAKEEPLKVKCQVTKMEKLKEDGQDSSSMEISYYASVPLEGVSYTVAGLLELVKNFPEHVKRSTTDLETR